MKLRDRRKVCQTFHGAGLVVPYNKDTEVNRGGGTRGGDY